MIRVSLTSFVDFVQASGMERLREVQKTKKLQNQKYSGKQDYYMPLRSKLVSALRTGSGIGDLVEYSEQGAPALRKGHYRKCVAGLSLFLKRNTVQWCGAISGDWNAKELSVHVNPELGLEIGGKKYAARVYFRKDDLDIIGVDTILYLISSCLCGAYRDYEPAILSARSGTLITKNKLSPKIRLVLEGEAAAMQTMWKEFEMGE